jgi:hypothetical protein
MWAVAWMIHLGAMAGLLSALSLCRCNRSRAKITQPVKPLNNLGTAAF